MKTKERKDSMSQIGDILEGHLNELLNRQDELSDKRLKICGVCPLATRGGIGLICDSKKWMNEKGEVILEPREGYTHGCGCRMSAKTRLENAKCVVGKW